MRFFDFPCSRQMSKPLLEETLVPPPSMPEDPRLRALCRPSNYDRLNLHQQRRVDQELGILDWDGVSLGA